MINKRQFKILNNKKKLHKIGKNWVTISALTLALLGGISASTVISHADQVNTGSKSITSQLPNRNITKVASSLHSHLISKASVFPTFTKASSESSQSSSSSKSTDSSNDVLFSPTASSSVSNRPHMMVGLAQTPSITNSMSDTNNLVTSKSGSVTNAYTSASNRFNGDQSAQSNNKIKTDYSNLTTANNNFKHAVSNWDGFYSNNSGQYNFKYKIITGKQSAPTFMVNLQKRTIGNLNKQIGDNYSPVYNLASMFQADQNQFDTDFNNYLNSQPHMSAIRYWGNTTVTFYSNGDVHISNGLIGIPSDFAKQVINYRSDNQLPYKSVDQLTNSDYKQAVNWDDNVNIDNYDQTFSDFFKNAQVDHLVDFNGIKHIYLSDVKLPKYAGWLFHNMPNLQAVTGNITNSDTNNMEEMFRDDPNLVNVNAINGLKLAPDISNMFENDTSLNNNFNQTLSSFDYSNVKNAGYFLHHTSDITYLDTSNWKNFHPTSVKDMFANMYKLQGINLKNFDTSKCTDFGSLFVNDPVLNNLDLSHFNTQNASDMEYMFANDNILSDITGLDKFNTKGVNDMSDMFANDYALKNLDLHTFNTTNSLNNMSDMFVSDADLQNLQLGSNTKLASDSLLPTPWMTTSTDNKNDTKSINYNPYNLADSKSHQGNWTRDAEVINFVQPSDNNKFLGHAKYFTGIQYWPLFTQGHPQQLNSFTPHQSEPNLFVTNKDANKSFKYATGIGQINYESVNASDKVDFIDAETGKVIPANNSNNSDSDSGVYGIHAFYNNNQIQSQRNSDTEDRNTSDSDYENNFSNNLLSGNFSNLPSGYSVASDVKTQLHKRASDETQAQIRASTNNTPFSDFNFGNQLNTFSIPLEKNSKITINFLTSGINKENRKHQKLSSHVINGYNTKKFNINNYSNLIPQGYTAWLVNNKPTLSKTILGKNITNFTDKDQVINVLVAPSRPNHLTKHNTNDPYTSNITVKFDDAKTGNTISHYTFNNKPVGTMFDASILPLPTNYIYNKTDFIHSVVGNNITQFGTYDQTMTIAIKKNLANVTVRYVDVNKGNKVVKTLPTQTGIKDTNDTKLTGSIIQSNIPSDYKLAEPQSKIIQLVPKFDNSIITIPLDHLKGRITIHYIDNNGQTIASDNTTTSDTGDTFKPNIKKINNYKYNSIKGNIITKYNHDKQDMTLIYDFDQYEHPNNGVGDIDVFYYHNHKLQLYQDYGNYKEGTPFDIGLFKANKFRILKGSNVTSFNNGLQTILLGNIGDTPHKILPTKDQIIPKSRIDVYYENAYTGSQLASMSNYSSVVNSPFNLNSVDSGYENKFSNSTNSTSEYSYLATLHSASSYDSNSDEIHTIDVLYVPNSEIPKDYGVATNTIKYLKSGTNSEISSANIDTVVFSRADDSNAGKGSVSDWKTNTSFSSVDPDIILSDDGARYHRISNKDLALPNNLSISSSLDDSNHSASFDTIVEYAPYSLSSLSESAKVIKEINYEWLSNNSSIVNSTSSTEDLSYSRYAPYDPYLRSLGSYGNWELTSNKSSNASNINLDEYHLESSNGSIPSDTYIENSLNPNSSESYIETLIYKPDSIITSSEKASATETTYYYWDNSNSVSSASTATTYDYSRSTLFDSTTSEYTSNFGSWSLFSSNTSGSTNISSNKDSLSSVYGSLPSSSYVESHLIAGSNTSYANYVVYTPDSVCDTHDYALANRKINFMISGTNNELIPASSIFTLYSRADNHDKTNNHSSFSDWNTNDFISNINLPQKITDNSGITYNLVNNIQSNINKVPSTIQSDLNHNKANYDYSAYYVRASNSDQPQPNIPPTVKDEQPITIHYIDSDNNKIKTSDVIEPTTGNINDVNNDAYNTKINGYNYSNVISNVPITFQKYAQNVYVLYKAIHKPNNPITVKYITSDGSPIKINGNTSDTYNGEPLTSDGIKKSVAGYQPTKILGNLTYTTYPQTDYIIYKPNPIKYGHIHVRYVDDSNNQKEFWSDKFSDQVSDNFNLSDDDYKNRYIPGYEYDNRVSNNTTKFGSDSSDNPHVIVVGYSKVSIPSSASSSNSVKASSSSKTKSSSASSVVPSSSSMSLPSSSNSSQSSANSSKSSSAKSKSSPTNVKPNSKASGTSINSTSSSSASNSVTPSNNSNSKVPSTSGQNNRSAQPVVPSSASSSVSSSSVLPFVPSSIGSSSSGNEPSESSSISSNSSTSSAPSSSKPIKQRHIKNTHSHGSNNKYDRYTTKSNNPKGSNESQHHIKHLIGNRVKPQSRHYDYSSNHSRKFRIHNINKGKYINPRYANNKNDKKLPQTNEPMSYDAVFGLLMLILSIIFMNLDKTNKKHNK